MQLAATEVQLSWNSFFLAGLSLYSLWRGLKKENAFKCIPRLTVAVRSY